MMAGRVLGAILVAREQNSPPSELEIRLQNYSNKGIRIVSKLTGGAHFLLPSAGAGGATLAIRFYEGPHLERLKQKYHYGNGEKDDTKGGGDVATSPERRLFSAVPNPREPHDVDNLRQFHDTFAYNITFFVLTPGTQMQEEQLGSPHSVVMQAQRALHSDYRRDKGKNQTMTRVCIVPDVTSAANLILSVVDAIKPAKRDSQQKYFNARAAQTGLPREDGTVPNTDMMASQSAGAFRLLTATLHIPEGEANVLMSFFGSIGEIATSTASKWNTIPVDETTKRTILSFFGAHSDTSVVDQGSLLTTDQRDASTKMGAYSEYNCPIDNHNLINSENSLDDTRNNFSGSPRAQYNSQIDNHNFINSENNLDDTRNNFSGPPRAQYNGPIDNHNHINSENNFDDTRNNFSGPPRAQLPSYAENRGKVQNFYREHNTDFVPIHQDHFNNYRQSIPEGQITTPLQDQDSFWGGRAPFSVARSFSSHEHFSDVQPPYSQGRRFVPQSQSLQRRFPTHRSGESRYIDRSDFNMRHSS